MAMSKTTYRPISCDFHDILEDAATRRLLTEVKYTGTDGSEHTVRSKIRDITVENQEEFLLLETGEKIRLDRLITVNHEDLKDY